MSERVYHVVNGAIVPKPGNQRDPGRRYRLDVDVSTGEARTIEYTAAEEAQRDEEERTWHEERPKRDAEAARQKAAAEAYRESLRYEMRMVAFVDVLGWKVAVDRSVGNPELVKVLGGGLASIAGQISVNNFLRDGRGEHDADAMLEMAQFSDSIVVSARATEIGINLLASALNSLSVSLLAQGLLLRGGIACGLMYHKGAIAYGPALVDAYLLEQARPGMPRIVLSDNLATLLGQGAAIASRAGETTGHFKTWRKDRDGRSFLDFLQPLGASSVPNSTSDTHAKAWLEMVRGPIAEGLVAHADDRKVRAKYRWLTNYFNAVAAEYPGAGASPISTRRRLPRSADRNDD